MSKSVVRYLLFLLAYIPLYIIAALKTFDDTIRTKEGGFIPFKEAINKNIIPILLIAITLILIIYFLVYSKLALKPKGNPIFTIKKVAPQHKEYVTYLGTYILPFVALEAKTVYDMVAFAFMFLTIGFIFSKTNLVYTNPTLVFFGFEIYEVEDVSGNKYDCISKDIFVEGDKPRGLKLGDKTFIISKWKSNN